MQQFLYRKTVFSFYRPFEETVECVDRGASQFCFCVDGHTRFHSPPSPKRAVCDPTLLSEALHWVAHMDYAGSSAAHVRLQVLSSCSNSSLSRLSQSQTSGKSR